MKYKPITQMIPQDKRREVNDKLLFLVDYGKLEEYGVTRQEVFNAYTGDGGLHGLKYEDYDNYSSYSSAKKEADNGQYLTPPLLAYFLMRCLKPDVQDVVMDLTGGTGVFANDMPAERNFYMNEIDIKAVKIARCLYPEANITHGDIREYDPKVKADIIVGNPPYNLSWRYDDEDIQSQYYYCLKAYRHLNPGGVLALIVPQSFLNDDFTDGAKIREIEERFSFICQFDLPDTFFLQSGVKCFNTKIMLFYANSKHLDRIPFRNVKTEVAISNDGADHFYDTFLRAHVEKKRQLKARLFYESLHGDSRWETERFLEKVRTYLFHIKSNPITAALYASCLQFVEDYANQRPPDGMKYDEWLKIKKTPEDVIRFLKDALSSQSSPPERDEIELVKSGGTIRYKAYSKKMEAQMERWTFQTSASLNDLVFEDDYPFQDNRFQRLVYKKRKAYENQTTQYGDVVPDAGVLTFLKEFMIYDSLNEREIRLNEKQLVDTAKILSKPYGIIQWEQGSGKTISALAQHCYRMRHNNIFCSFIVSTAISIHNNWDVVLPFYGVDYLLIRTWEDVA